MPLKAAQNRGIANWVRSAKLNICNSNCPTWPSPKLISLSLKNKIIEPEVDLDGAFKGFIITLVDGVNKIDFEALNEGFAAQNTAEFVVYDDKGVVISASQWNVGTGYKATIVLTKE